MLALLLLPMRRHTRMRLQRRAPCFIIALLTQGPVLLPVRLHVLVLCCRWLHAAHRRLRVSWRWSAWHGHSLCVLCTQALAFPRVAAVFPESCVVFVLMVASVWACTHGVTPFDIMSNRSGFHFFLGSRGRGHRCSPDALGVRHQLFGRPCIYNLTFDDAYRASPMSFVRTAAIEHTLLFTRTIFLPTIIMPMWCLVRAPPFTPSS